MDDHELLPGECTSASSISAKPKIEAHVMKPADTAAKRQIDTGSVEDSESISVTEVSLFVRFRSDE
uniref:Uncharacterized protein n=1 Tax=Schistosoma curassoni TaxID=6186 RepID=A0A183KCV0_9TREM